VKSIQALHINKLNKLKKNLSKQNFKWILVSKSYESRKKCAQYLKNESKIDFAEILHKVSYEKRAEFLSTIEELSLQNNNKLWWLSNLSYNSPLTSNLFWQFCCIYSLKQIINEYEEDIVILSDDENLLNSIKDNFNLDDKETRSWSKIIKSICINNLKTYSHFFTFLFRSILLFVLNAAVRKIKRVNNEYFDKFYYANTIRFTWIEKRSFKTGIFEDVYLPNLEKFQSSSEKILTLTLPLIDINLIGAIYNSKEILPIIKLFDIRILVRCLCNAYRFNICLDHHKSEIDLKILLKSEIYSNRYLLLYPLLHYELVKKFLKKSSSLKTIIYPFENQPFERALIYAKNEINVDIKLIGYQHASIPLNLLNYFISPSLAGIIPTPDTIITNSLYNKKLLEESGWRCELVNGGNLRVSYPKISSTIENSIKVLVVLSYDLSSSLNFLENLILLYDPKYHYLIKPHPDFSEKVIRAYIKDFPYNFEFINTPLSETFSSVRKVIHNGTSSNIECLASGLTVYKFLDDSIDLDPLLNTGITQISLFAGKKFDLSTEIKYQPDIENFLESPNLDVWQKYI
jgi:hypothetical protein